MGVVIGAAVAARLAAGKFVVVGITLVWCVFDFATWIATGDGSHLVYGALTAVIVVANIADRWRADRKVNLKGELMDLRDIAERNTLRLDEKDRQIEHSDAKVVRLEAEVEQLCEQVLKLKGFGYSRERKALRTRPPAGSFRRALIVEDHEPTGQRLGQYLELNGLHAEVCRTADEAIALIRRGVAFDVVLLDLLMPGGDADDEPSGLAVLRAIRQSPAPIPAVVVVTGSDNPAHHERARNHGAAAVLVKPVDLDELLALLGREPGA